MRPFLTILLVTLLVGSVSSAQRSRRLPRRPGTIPGQVVVGLAAGTPANDVAEETGTAVQGSISGLDLHLLALPDAGAESAMLALQQCPEVRFLEANYLVQSPEAAGCDLVQAPSAQPCTIAEVDSTPTIGEYVDQPAALNLSLASAQALSQGIPATVAVVDTGIDPTHSLFQGRLWSAGYDFILDRPGGIDLPDGLDNDGDGWVDEAYGHGTHVAGLIVLVNPDAKIIPLRVLDSDGHGTSFHVAQGVFEAVASGAQVINLSLSMRFPSQAVSEAIEMAQELGITVLASAGNTGQLSTLYPARNDGVVAVAAVDAADRIADFSAYGPEVDVSAPGVDLYSALPGEQWAWWSGTSMACAVASGCASLTMSVAGPDESDTVDAIQQGTIFIDPLNPGFAGLLGTGRIDAYLAALEVLDTN